MVDARRPPVALVRGGRDREPKRPEGGPGAEVGQGGSARLCISAVLYAPWRIERQSSAGQGYTGAELLRLLAGHPEIEVVHVTADSNAGARRRRPLSVAGGPAYGDFGSRRSTRPTSPGSTSCSSRCRTARARRSLPGLLDDVAHVIDLGADFRLPADVYERWYGEPHTAPESARPLRVRARRAVPRRRSRRATHVAAPGCYPTAVSLALAPLLALGLVEPHA